MHGIGPISQPKLVCLSRRPSLGCLLGKPYARIGRGNEERGPSVGHGDLTTNDIRSTKRGDGRAGQTAGDMADVAAQAGVSVSTVSHVVNGTRHVSGVLRTRVLDVIGQSGYSPNAVARSLVMRDTHLIGIVMSALTNRFFVPVVSAIDRAGPSPRL